MQFTRLGLIFMKYDIYLTPIFHGIPGDTKKGVRNIGLGLMPEWTLDFFPGFSSQSDAPGQQLSFDTPNSSLARPVATHAPKHPIFRAPFLCHPVIFKELGFIVVYTTLPAVLKI